MSDNKKTPMPKFIALSGKKQTGKDTTTNMLVEMLETDGKRVKITAFAEPLKELCIELLGLDRKLVYGSNADKDTLCHIQWEGFSNEIRKKYTLKKGRWSFCSVPRSGPMTVREVLQVMGTDVFRSIVDDVWARAPFNKDWSGYDVVILTDCRFPNEKKVTEERNGIIIRLERDTGYIDNHPSETALDDAEFSIKYSNNDSLDSLKDFARKVLKDHNLI